MGSNDLPYRRYPRANFHDYNGGTYFVTVCTRDKRHYLGEIYNGDMHLSVLGKCLENNLRDVSSHFTDITVPMFVVMPNHFHAIISIVGSRPVATANLGKLNQLARISLATNTAIPLSTHYNSRLAVLIGGIKAYVTRHANKHDIEFGWQNRYHEHIIRGSHDGNRIAEYIENNVARWDIDCFYN